MKNKLMTLAGALALLAVLGHFYAKPLLAQVRAALVQNVDEPGRNPLNLKVNFPTSSSVSVPAGKRYVIEAFAATCTVDFGGSLTGIGVHTASDAGADAFAPGFFLFAGLQGDQWAASGTTRLYADPGSTIFLETEGRTSTPTCQISLSGYIINNP